MVNRMAQEEFGDRQSLIHSLRRKVVGQKKTRIHTNYKRNVLKAKLVRIIVIMQQVLRGNIR
jgi:hypothetical protein